MGKNKKASLTHAEIWDDSALVQSWDDAVEEYELYHSIHAKGENVEDVLREAEESGFAAAVQSLDKQTPNVAADPIVQPEGEDNAMNIDEHTSSAISSSTNPAVITVSAKEAAKEPSQPADFSEASASAMPMPHPIMATVQDESLKNLMMSWYYAGYYTGLHEGQQQASRR